MKSISAATIALSLVIGSLTSAHADGRDYDRHDESYARQQHGDWDHRDRGDHWKDHDHDRHSGNHDYGNSDRAYRDGYRQGRYDAGRYIRPHGYYHHAWRRGDKLPRGYYSNRYVVRNYREYRLHAPPRGYHWVRVERDVVLAAVTTGVIVSVIDGLFH
jgi:Ni/Co efflux regulator RcnB